MFDTWPRLQTNLAKLKSAINRLDYTVDPYNENDKEASASAVEKAKTVERALLGMHANPAFNEKDFRATLGCLLETRLTGVNVLEVDWEKRNKEIVPKCTRRIPARYYRWPYIAEETDRLMLNPSGTLGGTQLMDFPKNKFLVGIYTTYSDHPIYCIAMRVLTPWWVAQRFGLEWFMTFAQIYGIPYRKATYTAGDQLVYNKLVQMLQQSGASSWGIFPEGTEVEILQTHAAGTVLPQEKLIVYADSVCDIMLLGQTLTTEEGHRGSRALGGVHKEVFDEITQSHARWCCDLINTQLIPGIIQYNFGNTDELPKLKPVIKTPIELLQIAQAFQILFGRGQGQMAIPVKKSELYDKLDFTEPDDESETYEPEENPNPPPPSPMPFGGPKPIPGGDGQNPDQQQPHNQPPPSPKAEAAHAKPGCPGSPPDRGAIEKAVATTVELYFKNNAEQIDGIHWVSIVDSRTTPQCLDLNGKEWTYPEFKPVDHGVAWPGFPPIRYNCRSSVLPILVDREAVEGAYYHDEQGRFSQDPEKRGARHKIIGRNKFAYRGHVIGIVRIDDGTNGAKWQYQPPTGYSLHGFAKTRSACIKNAKECIDEMMQTLG